MGTKAQHDRRYRFVPQFLREMREASGLTQRDIDIRLKKPQSWVYNCETGNRRVDVAEFVAWADACDVEARRAFARLLKVMVG